MTPAVEHDRGDTGAFLVGAAETPYTRHPGPAVSTLTAIGDAVRGALASAGMEPSAVDGLAVASFSLKPDHAVDLAWRLGLRLRWLLEDTNGGASGLNMLGHAVSAIRNGDASVIVIVSGDVLHREAQAELSSNYNVATRENLTPIGYQGPNAVFAMLTQRQIEAFGLTAETYGNLVVAQRAWAAENPGAVYRTPLSMDDYLTAPLVADPLRRYDCVPPAAGADALVLVAADHLPQDVPAVRVRALRRSINHDHQEGDGLSTGLADVADDLWRDAGAGPQDMQGAFVYDDYPAMVLAQLNDLGFVPDGDIAAFSERELKDRRFPVNTSGGMLSAGQAGAAGGSHGLVEAVTQLQHRAGDRQVPGIRLAAVTGYGMVLYRYGAIAGAAVLEREQAR